MSIFRSIKKVFGHNDRKVSEPVLTRELDNMIAHRYVDFDDGFLNSARFDLIDEQTLTAIANQVLVDAATAPTNLEREALIKIHDDMKDSIRQRAERDAMFARMAKASQDDKYLCSDPLLTDEEATTLGLLALSAMAIGAAAMIDYANNRD